ncbi:MULTISPECIES: hypothetical protein [unclassified Polaromonas]|uniref:hypothetical protein n=1 Tax=unclassified Polaromonas TaxID=2638319 RepID=UPI000F074AFF|nr:MULTISPECIES: hypothetical protein [unclassified Polaromonas]AYQ27197.1 hypothetical protein DT070_03605 [Polaromonas sp. SP1]QGJ17959.1 hypothetical protein F7R28_05835 [Polaromonas sp. Pch-P]
MEHVAVVGHDAGGAEILSSWLNRADFGCSVVVAGPAAAIFRRKCPEAEYLSLDDALDKCTWVLCGTGWQSSYEREAIVLGRARGKKTVAFLDHWVNYRERFQDASQSVLPDEIWVGDADAERIARPLFPEIPVVLQANPYFEDLLAEIARMNAGRSHPSATSVLYVCEPVADHALAQYGDERYWGYTEHDALRFFLENIGSLGQKIDAITIRPHPSERAEKYHWASEFTALPIKFGGQQTLLEETIESDIVVGCESMAMVVGLLAGKRVISTIPPAGRPCQLPQGGIEHMRRLAAGAAHHV